MTIQVSHKTHKKMQTVIHNVLSVRLSEDKTGLMVFTKDETPQTFSLAEWDFEKRVSVWLPLTMDECKPYETCAEIVPAKQ